MGHDAPGLRWLHLTDLHVGRPAGGQSNALGSLVASIQAETAGQKVDLVLLTGDLVYSGKHSEYEEFERTVLEPLKSLDAFDGAHFVSVPGNHDLDCDEGVPISWDALGDKRRKDFFFNEPAGKKVRSSRAAGFLAYSSFVQRNGILSVDPTQEVATRISVGDPPWRTSFVLTTTCFFSDKDTSEQSKAPFPVSAVRPLVSSVNDERIIVLGHHPIAWFLQESTNHFRALLGEIGGIYINGHEHEVRTEFNGRGLLSLGFGAAYQADIDGKKNGNYRNSYAICQLEEHLHIKIFSWDHEYGKWRPENNLPPDFLNSSHYLAGGYQLSIPSTRLTSATTTGYGSLASSLQQLVSFDRCIWLVKENTNRWASILKQLGLFTDVLGTSALESKHATAGNLELRIRDRRGDHLVCAISAPGNILTYDQLQSLNTALDTQGYCSCIIVTLGQIAQEASTLATQLKLKKPIQVFERDHIIREILRKLDSTLKRAIAATNPAEINQWLLVTDDDIGVLRQDRLGGSWFEVLNGQAVRHDESSAIVSKIRRELPEFESIRYRALADDQPALFPSEAVEFDRAAYMSASYQYFDDVKYAPLAALGLRFRHASLTEIYVGANADANASDKSEEAITRAVEEFIESLRLPPSQRDQLEAQVRARLTADERSAEVGAARQLYQRHNNIIVLGDPGSGKTCFVKNEILAYCRPPEVGASWYSSHIPIYVSLAEAARLAEDEVDLFEICETVSARRGAVLSKQTILRAVSDGHAAFFFDGLDEVGSIEKRAKLMTAISQLIESHAARGNRFVIASRPAAVQPVQVPALLKYLHLRGLTEDEIRTLAGRVLTVRLGEDEEKSLSEDEHRLVDKLIEDTRLSPGIARIARNPLLLTLLVLIYANTGSLSAKRHLIYTQAIKTLVSVRGREGRTEQLAEADLRTRLGGLAVAIFKREIDEIPRRAEVGRILQPLVPGGQAAVDAFLQEVAEATGLLKLHRDDVSRQNDLVTFMHYSFLEYYAAAGLLNGDYSQTLNAIAERARWKDVVTLLFGILSEQTDITPALRVLLTGGDQNQTITKSRLLLAMDCAAECDVPPSEAQALLAEEVYATVSGGAGLVSGQLREDLARRMVHFFHGGAGLRFHEIIIKGLRQSDVVVKAAFADLISYLPNDLQLSDEIIREFHDLLGSESSIATVAGMKALQRRQDLRPASAPSILRRSLRGNLVEKDAALALLKAVPSYYKECAALAEELLSDTNDFISSAAAQCILYCDVDLVSLEKRALQETVLAKLNLATGDDFGGLSYVTLNRVQIETMLRSGNRLDRELALRYSPLIKGETDYVYRLLTSHLRSSRESRLQSACLDALRSAQRYLDLLTIADADHICALASNPERNVRVSSLRLLAEMPGDEQVHVTLLSRLEVLRSQSTKDVELVEVAKAISKHAVRNKDLRTSVLELLESEFPSPGSFGGPEQQSNVAALLNVVEAFTGEKHSKLAGKALRLAEDFRSPEALRRHALKVFGKLADSTPENLEALIRLLDKNDLKLNEAAYGAVIGFLNECKGNINSIRRVHSSLQSLGACLARAWTREVARSGGRIDVSAIRDLRQSAIDVNDLWVQYEEFSERARPVAAA